MTGLTFTTYELSVFLLGLLAKGAVLLVAAWLASLALRRTSAAFRHGVWVLVFAGLMLLPLFTVVLPQWSVSVFPVSSSVARQRPVTQRTVIAGSEAMPVLEKYAKPIVVPSVEDESSAFASPMSWPWTMWGLLIWATGACVLLVRFGIGLMHLAWMNRKAGPITNPAWTTLLERSKDRLNINVRRSVRLRKSDHIQVPMTFGRWRPIVLLPSRIEHWTDDQRRAVLLHELAHIKRYDFLTHWVGRIACAFHWPNPLVWYAARRLLVEREKACDDQVLASGIAASNYAEQLIGMARGLLSHRNRVSGALAMARPSELETRVLAILDDRQDRHPMLTRLQVFGMTTLAVALILPLAAMQSSHADAEAPVQVVSAEVLAATQLVDTENVGSQQTASGEVTAVRAVQNEPTSQQEKLKTKASKTPEKAGVSADAPDDARSGESRPKPQVVSPPDTLDSDNEEAEIQEQALFALSRLPREQSVPMLIDIVRTHQNQEIREKAIFWLGNIGGDKVVSFFSQLLEQSTNPEIQEKLVFAISRLPNEESVPRLIEIAKTHPNPEIREKAIFWLGQSGDPRAADALMDIIQAQ